MKKLGFGLMRLPQITVDGESVIDIETTKKMVDTFMEKGFTYFDTAACYHNGFSETAFKEAVSKRYPRSSYTITDKLSLFMINKAEDMQDFFNSELERLGVDYLDYYLIHALGADSYRKAQDFKAFEFVKKLKEEGKVKHFGFSFHDSAEVLDKILTEQPEVEYVQLQLNYIDWDDESVQSRKCYDVAMKHGKTVIVMEPVKGGSLVNVPQKVVDLYKSIHPELSVASWAVRFAASHNNVMMVLSGMSNEEQLNDNVSYMDNFKPLDDEENKAIKQAVTIIKESITVACTGCRYCVEGCPKNIAIPDYFTVYNKVERINGLNKEKGIEEYNEIAKTNGKASDCISCGKCENICPQHLKIRDYLKDVANKFES